MCTSKKRGLFLEAGSQIEVHLRHFCRVIVGGRHKAGRASSACFEWSARVLADHGADDREFLQLPGTEICIIVSAVIGEYAGRPLAGSGAPSPAKSRAGDSKEPTRTKPKGFAPTPLYDC